MSQGVQFNGVVEGISTRSDGSLGIRLSTGEFSPEDKLVMFGMQNLACTMVFAPTDSEQPPKEIKAPLSTKTPSQRLRAVLFCWYKSLGEPGQWEAFYENEISKHINAVKAKLPPL